MTFGGTHFVALAEPAARLFRRDGDFSGGGAEPMVSVESINREPDWLPGAGPRLREIYAYWLARCRDGRPYIATKGRWMSDKTLSCRSPTTAKLSTACWCLQPCRATELSAELPGCNG